jgi:hypothetical protein
MPKVMLAVATRAPQKGRLRNSSNGTKGGLAGLALSSQEARDGQHRDVVTEARAARPGNRALLVILDHRVAPQPESRSEAAEASARRLPSFRLELMGRD